MRRFGRRGFGTRRRSFSRRKLARQLGAYEMLLEDFTPAFAGQTCGHTLTFSTGPNGAQSYKNSAFNVAMPPDLLGATAAQQIVRADNSGFTMAIPLWDNRLSNKWQQDCTLRSIRGYLRPTLVTYVSPNGTFNQPIKVRMAIVMQTVSEDMALEGNISAGIPQFIWSHLSQRQKIVWQRDWYMTWNPSPGTEQNYNYWDPISITNLGFAREPRLASNGGSDLVRLKRLGRITRTRWPVLLIGIKADFPALDVTASNDLLTLNSAVELDIDFQGSLRAYVTR